LKFVDHDWHRAATFKKCCPLAHKYKLRLIAVSRRGFGGSTPFHADEVDAIKRKEASKDDFAKFMADRAWELATFIRILTEKNAGILQGGISLMGWSLGNAYCLKLLEMLEDGAFGELGAMLNTILDGYIMYGMHIQFALQRVIHYLT
jgi:pimeloyl-ACP methyl ester carboxylesterase